MSIAITSTLRDAAAGTPVPAPVVTAPQPAPQPVPPQPDDTFGPATRVEISGLEQRSTTTGTETDFEIQLDTTTKTIVYQSKDPSTGAVIYQIPDEAKMRLRAYLEDMAAQQAANATAGTHPDPAAIDSIRV